jgi:hypothetical protein
MGAILSDDGVYRYKLWRDLWPPCGVVLASNPDVCNGCGAAQIYNRPDEHRPRTRVLFVMLNPSTADAAIDDPTIRKCKGFAKLWGFAYVAVANLYAFRATDPRDLWKARAPIVGAENDSYIMSSALDALLVVCAWGAHAKDSSRVAAVRKILRDSGAPTVALGFSKSGHPRHPLMLSYDTERSPW